MEAMTTAMPSPHSLMARSSSLVEAEMMSLWSDYFGDSDQTAAAANQAPVNSVPAAQTTLVNQPLTTAAT